MFCLGFTWLGTKQLAKCASAVGNICSLTLEMSIKKQSRTHKWIPLPPSAEDGCFTVYIWSSWSVTGCVKGRRVLASTSHLLHQPQSQIVWSLTLIIFFIFFLPLSKPTLLPTYLFMSSAQIYKIWLKRDAGSIKGSNSRVFVVSVCDTTKMVI